jgi:hypothetical protein
MDEAKLDALVLRSGQNFTYLSGVVYPGTLARHMDLTDLHAPGGDRLAEERQARDRDEQDLPPGWWSAMDGSTTLSSMRLMSILRMKRLLKC